MTVPRLSEDGGNYFPSFLSYGLRFSLVLLRSIKRQVKLSQTPQMKLFKKFLNINAKFVNAGRIGTDMPRTGIERKSELLVQESGFSLLEMLILG